MRALTLAVAFLCVAAILSLHFAPPRPISHADPFQDPSQFAALPAPYVWHPTATYVYPVNFPRN